MIKILDAAISSRIAAGEVVEKPSSVLRELLDNAIDSKATKISVFIEEGGIKNITVSDNGCGIAENEIKLAFLRHATSKISTIEDLYKLKTLGFRGEALYSIASVSNLSILSSSVKLSCNNGEIGEILPGSVSEGTTVIMENLFEQLPARKQFLRRPSSEANDCKKIFIEKALSFENIEFLFFSDNNLVFHFPDTSLFNRCSQIMALPKNSVLEMSAEDDPVKLYAVAGTPSYYKRDRTQIKIFVNRRITDNYQLTQAISSSFSVALPGGAFPYFCLFIEDDPQLVDFNIHPTKRECKIRNLSMVHSMITKMIRNALLEKSIKETRQIIHPEIFIGQSNNSQNINLQKKSSTYYKNILDRNRNESIINYEDRKTDLDKKIPDSNLSDSNFKKKPSEMASFSNEKNEQKFKPSWLDNAKRILGNISDYSTAEKKISEVKSETVNTDSNNINIVSDIHQAISKNWIYIGQVFNTYLIVQNKENLIFIDQHAAHERILFEELKNTKDIQKLLVPYRFETTPDADEFLKEKSFIYHELGITIARLERMVWQLVSIPAACRKNEKEIVSYISHSCGDIEEVQKGLFAIIACHAAIKAGDILDNTTAISLIEKTFALNAMLCPHGRNFSFVLNKEELDHNVGRKF